MDKKGIEMKATLFLLVVLLLVPSNFITAQQKDISGIWSGKLELPNSIKLSLVFNITRDEAGNYVSTLDSPDQGAKGIPTESTSITEDSLLIKIPAVQGFYSGKILYDDMKIEGKWSQSSMKLDLILIKVDKIEEPKRPQEPKPPFPYKSEDITFENKIDSITLAGTLTVPKEGNDFPAVVMITGSGAQNRDEELLGHKPFFVIADYLTRNGIAVLRFDDRGTAESTGDYSKATSEDFAKDVLSAVEYLKTRYEINHSKIGLIGHSEGGLIAPMVEVQSNDIAFIILMAGPGIRGDSILYLQSALIARAEGTGEEEIQKTLNSQRKYYSMVISIDEDETLERRIREKFNNEYSEMSDEEKSNFGDSDAFMSRQIKILTSPWFKYFLKYNPQPTLEKVTCPVLAINGENDLQVPPEENLSAIESALKKSGNTNYEIKKLPGLNHLFQTSSTGAVSEYGTIEETISPIALQTMLDWIKKIAK